MQMKMNKKLAGLISGGIMFAGSVATNVVLGIKLKKERRRLEDTLDELDEVASRLEEELDVDNHYTVVDDETLEYLMNAKIIMKESEKEDEESDTSDSEKEKSNENSK